MSMFDENAFMKEFCMTPSDPNTQPFVPPEFVVPEVFETPLFRLRMLAVTDVEKDYEAVMESADLLNAMLGRNWPSADFSLENNLQDLAEHQEEFERREAFAYTVVALDESRCLGCVYINPPRDYPTDARIYMWVRQSAYEQGLDPILFASVKQWIEESWPFETVWYPGRDATGAWYPLNGAAV